MTTHALYRRLAPWPFRLLGWLFVVAALLIVAALLAVGGTGAYYEVTRTKAGDIEAMIEEDLSRVATTDQVLFFLDSHDIEHGAVRPSTDEDRRLLEAGVPAGTMTISGIVRNDGYALQLRDVVLWFILDDEGLLEGHLVYEVGR